MAELHDWTEDEYHADPCEQPSLSQSIAKTLVTDSALHAWTQHPRLGGIPRPPTKSLDDGTAVHELLLGGDRIVAVDYPDFRKAAARIERDNAIEAGKVPICAPKLAELRDVAESLRVRIEAMGFDLDAGQTEASITWTEDSRHGPVLCRGRMDFVAPERGLIVDLKSARSANPKKLGKHFHDYGLDIQWAAYTRALEQHSPEMAGRVDFVFLCCELVPPYSVTPCRPNGEMRMLGNARWARAVDAWARCIRDDHWPDYTDGEIVDIAPPVYALADEEAIEADKEEAA